MQHSYKHLYIAGCLFLVLQVGRGTGLSCTRKNISFYEYQLIPDGGLLMTMLDSESAGHNCTRRDSVQCFLQSANSFLPDPKTFLSTYRWQAMHHCDDSLSALLDSWLKAYPMRSVPGLPYTTWREKKSIGKYLRFNSDLAYTNFFENGTILNIDYSTATLEWPWSDGVDICQGEFHGWNCAFQRFDSANTSHSSYWISYAERARDAVDRVELFRIFRERPTHISQTLFFGKFVSIMTEPSIWCRSICSRI